MAGLPFDTPEPRECATCHKDLTNSSFEQKVQEYQDTVAGQRVYYCDRECWTKRPTDDEA